MFSAVLTEKIRVLYEKQLTGFLKISGPEGKQWYLYFLLGRIVWGQAGFHDLRRWQRYVALHNPVFFEQVNQPVSLYYEYWNYASLAKLVRRKQFPRDVFSKVVEYYVAEVIFDIIRTGTLHYSQPDELLMESVPRSVSKMPFIMLESLQSLQRAKQEWQRWSQVGLAKISPDWAPTIEDPETLKDRIPASTFQTLSSFANGEKTLRDISIECKQPIIPITKSILPHVSKQLLTLATLPDLVDTVTHGFHLELKASDKDSESKEDADKRTFTEASAQAVDVSEIDVTSSETASPKADIAKTASSETTFSETTSSEKVPPKTASSETMASEISSSKITAPETISSTETVPSGTVLPEGNPSQPVVADVENSDEKIKANEQLITSIREKLNSSLHKSDLPNLQAAESKVLTLERAVAKGNPSAQPVASEENTAAPATNSLLPKIAHIEDSLFDSRIMSPIVERLGYRYINIQDPLQALPMLIEIKPELIFLDLIMPMANGFEVCAQIRRMTLFQQTPIIIVTSNKGIIDRLRVKMSGASGFMSKPIKEKKVKKIFKKHIENNR
ncbi:MAG: response regulator [Cyanobacteria bacterium J06560_5]